MEFVWNIALFILIVGGSALITQWFTRNVYRRCPKCHSLNAKRRTACRVCGEPTVER